MRRHEGEITPKQRTVLSVVRGVQQGLEMQHCYSLVILILVTRILSGNSLHLKSRGIEAR